MAPSHPSASTSSSSDFFPQLRLPKPINPPTATLHPQTLPGALPVLNPNNIDALTTTLPPQTDTPRPFVKPSSTTTSSSSSASVPSPLSSQDRYPEDRRVDRPSTGSGPGSRPSFQTTSSLSQRISRRELARTPRTRTLAVKRLRGSAPSASSSTSSLTELAARPSVPEELPPPEQLDKMARAHRRRHSESGGPYFQQRRQKQSVQGNTAGSQPHVNPVKRQQLSLADFRLGKVLGSGGTATVVRAEVNAGSTASKTVPAREVAVKAVAKRGLSRRAQHYLAREIAIHRNVQHHPNIAALYDVFEDASGIYLVLEYLKGSDLYSVLRKERRLVSEKAALAIIVQVFDALRHMHSRGCSHRDIKPENIMFIDKPNLSEGKVTSLKLVDFGLSCARNPEAPLKERQSSEKCGTVRYAAPEIVTKASYVPEYCDIWSTGIVLYSIIAHRNPFTGRTEKEVLHQIQHTPVSFEGVEWERVSNDTKNLIRACLNLNASERPTAESAYSEVNKILGTMSARDSNESMQIDDSSCDGRSIQRRGISDTQGNGLNFSRFTSDVTHDESSSQVRREKRARNDMVPSAPSSSDENSDHPFAFLDGLRAWFSGQSPARESSSVSH